MLVWEQRILIDVIATVPKSMEDAMLRMLATAHNFYYLAEQHGGLWSVNETVSHKPVSLNGQLCCSLKKRDAEELIEYLNGLDASLAA